MAPDLMWRDDRPSTHGVRRGLHGQVVDDLGRQIVTGVLSPGDGIDPDGLAAEAGVSRTVVREAIKVLTTKGLVDARPRIGTYVLPRSDWNLLDQDVIVWRNSQGGEPRLLHELEEVRQIIEPSGARWAAQRRTEEDLDELEQALATLGQPGDRASAQQVDADVTFHRTILRAAGNELLERLERLLEPALRARDELAFRHHHGDGFLQAHREVLDCIREQRPDDAFLAMQALLAEASSDTAASLLRSDSHSSR